MSYFTAAPARALLGLALIAGAAAPSGRSRIDVIASSLKGRTMQATVQVADLNLASKQGQAALNRRIAYAAQEVCGKDELYSIDAKSDYRRCRVDAISAARAQVDQRLAARDTSPVRLTRG